MIHAASSSTSVVIGNGIISNKLHSASVLPLDDQKDPEPEREATLDVDEAEIETGNTETGPSKHRLVVTEAPKEQTDEPTEQATLRGLSLRASRMCEYLRASNEVTALLLCADGSAKEISYDASASQTRKVLDGSASIVGSIEGLEAIIVRAQSSSGERNDHSLPGDVEGGHRGDYLIFRADAEGNAANLSLSEYQLFAAANPSSNQRSADRIDAQNIHARPKASNLVFVRSEIDRQIRDEFDNSSADESEIEQAKQQRFRDVVERIVADFSSSPLDDPNFDVDEAIDSQQREESTQTLEIVGTRISHRNIQTDDASDQNDWPIGALCFLRNYGRSDGSELAQRIESQFADKAPSNEEMAQILFAVEDFKANVDAVHARGVPEQNTLDFALEIEAKLIDAAPCDLMGYAQSIVEKDLVSRAKSLLRRVLGREGREDELRQTVRDMAVKMAEAALNNAATTNDDDAQSESESDDTESENENDESSEVEALRTTATFRSRTGSAETYSVYFGDESKSANVSAALRSFRKFNHREPTASELRNLCRFLTTLDVDAANAKERKLPRSPQKVLVTPIRTSKTRAAAFSVYFEDTLRSEAQNERVAVQWFERFNGRAPDDTEREQLRELLKVPDSAELREYIVPNFSIDDESDTESEQENEPTKASTAFTLTFDDSESEREHGDEETAALWFERFNKRKPNREECRKINAFLKL